MRRGVRVGIDWGDARIGVARCDPDGVLATPYATVRAGARELDDLLAVLAELEPLEVVVGFADFAGVRVRTADPEVAVDLTADLAAAAELVPGVPVRLRVDTAQVRFISA